MILINQVLPHSFAQQPLKPEWSILLGGYGDQDDQRLIELLYLAERRLRDDLLLATQRLLDGAVSLPEWQADMAQQIKRAFVGGLRLGRGPEIGFADYGAAGSALREQYRLIDNFANRIYEGNLTGKQILQRAGLYAWNLVRGFFVGQKRAKTDAGYQFMQRFLTPGESCNDCIYYESLGKQPVGALPAPGEQSACGGNCRCQVVYYKD
jgi:hypothetical protein